GINRGHLGYLCELDEESVYGAINALLEGEVVIEERMMLEGYITTKERRQSKTFRALNDIVVSSLNGLQVIHMSVFVGNEFLYSFHGDGMIFATPTGSTAYNLSANGPIVDPKTDVILMTPINPHTLNSRSIVIDRRDEVALEIVPRRGFASDESVAVSFDGERGELLHPGEQVVVHRSSLRARMIKLSKMSFLERIRSKMVSE
ncbi:MAG: NAD(+)/NADH kinase, partial [Lachnospiraceae bacterium]|nr:NAD(+)/NADH kinase [Lachnospiraceae bacterium]